MKTMKISKYSTIYAAVPMFALLAAFGLHSLRLEGDRERKQLDSQWASGMRYEETATLQGNLDGVKTVEANNVNAALAGAEGAGISKALGGSNKEAAGAAVVNALVVGAIEHLMAGCHVWIAVDGTHKRFRAEDWVCVKYKDQKNIPVTVERTIRYTTLGLPGQHKPESEYDRNYTPKFQ